MTEDRVPLPGSLPPDADFGLLATQFLDGSLGADDLPRLNQQLLRDGANCREFVRMCLFAGVIAESLRPQLDALATPDNPAFPPLVAQSSPIAEASVSSFRSAVFHGAVGYFSSGWPVAYLIATVIFGMGILVGSLVYVSQPKPVAKQSILPSTFGRGAGGEGSENVTHSRPTVGRITGMVECQFDRPKTQELRPKTAVSLGDKFALAAGLLEITYDTGATVVLQGPVTYEVESKDGGFLSLGKLTAKVDKGLKIRDKGLVMSDPQDPRPKTEDPRPESEISHPSSLIPHPLFSVRTPIATVTDLGTEFGVEVRASGSTTACVFRGVVQVQSGGMTGRQGGKAVRLGENESVQVERSGSGEAVKVSAGKIDPAAFVRSAELRRLASEQKLKPFHRWQADSRKLRRDPSLLAYYDFQQKEGLPAVLPNVAQDGRGLSDGTVENATWTDGRMPGKHALLFNGPSDLVRIELPQKTQALTLAAWVCFDSLDHCATSGVLMSAGLPSPGINWQVNNKSGCLVFAHVPSGGWDSRPVIDSGRLRCWMHLASVYDPSAMRIRFYADGRAVGGADLQSAGPIIIGRACIANWEGGHEPRYFRGKIDELTIFGRPLNADELRQMYEQGRP